MYVYVPVKDHPEDRLRITLQVFSISRARATAPLFFPSSIFISIFALFPFIPFSRCVVSRSHHRGAFFHERLYRPDTAHALAVKTGSADHTFLSQKVSAPNHRTPEHTLARPRATPSRRSNFQISNKVPAFLALSERSPYLGGTMNCSTHFPLIPIRYTSTLRIHRMSTDEKFAWNLSSIAE